jgi:hypothetical protein
MIKIVKDLSVNQKVSSQLAFIFLILISFVLVWCTVNAGKEISNSAKSSVKSDMYDRYDKAEKELGIP